MSISRLTELSTSIVARELGGRGRIHKDALRCVSLALQVLFDARISLTTGISPWDFGVFVQSLEISDFCSNFCIDLTHRLGFQVGESRL